MKTSIWTAIRLCAATAAAFETIQSSPSPRSVCANGAEEARTTIAAGQRYSCAITAAEGRAICWGTVGDALMVHPIAHADQASIVSRSFSFGVSKTKAGICSTHSSGAVCWGDIDNEFSQKLASSAVSSVALAPWQGYSTYVCSRTDGPIDGPETLSPACAVIDGGVQCSNTAATCGFYFPHSCAQSTYDYATNSRPYVFKTEQSCSVAEPPETVTYGQVAVALADSLACSLSNTGDVTCWSLWEECGASKKAASTPKASRKGHKHKRESLGSLSYGAGSDSNTDASTVAGATAWNEQNHQSTEDNTKCKKVLQQTDFEPPVAASTGQLLLSAGHDYMCSLSRSGGVSCWGPGKPHVPQWARVDVIALAAAPGYTCAIINSTPSSTDGGVRCWAQKKSAFNQPLASQQQQYQNLAPAVGPRGSINIVGAIADEVLLSELSSAIFTPPEVLAGQVALAAGPSHVCSLSVNGSVSCWGNIRTTVPEMLQLDGAVKLPCIPRDASSLPPPPSPAETCTNAVMRPFANHDAIGTRLSTTTVASESECRLACCVNAACMGYSFATHLVTAAPSATDGDSANASGTALCVQLSDVTQLVPSNVMSAGVRPRAIPA